MSETTKIQWCDSTVNFWEGCTKVSPGCANCYAKTRDDRQLIEKVSHWGKGAPRRKSKSAVKDALAMNRKPWICDQCGDAYDNHPDDDNGGAPAVCKNVVFGGVCCMSGQFHRRRIFSLSLSDWLDEEVPIEWLAEMLDTIRQCDQVTWILCTKRPENFSKRLVDEFELRMMTRMAWGHCDNETWKWVRKWTSGNPPLNVILLTSVENQEQADKRIPELLKIPAACRGLSLEPLLGPVQMPAYSLGPLGHIKGIDWLIIGGESGPNARPCNVDWIRSLVRQGKAAGVATFVKQLGANAVDTNGCFVSEFSEAVAEAMRNQKPEPLNLNDKKGADPSEWPADLRVQEWPKGF